LYELIEELSLFTGILLIEGTFAEIFVDLSSILFLG